VLLHPPIDHLSPLHPNQQTLAGILRAHAGRVRVEDDEPLCVGEEEWIEVGWLFLGRHQSHGQLFEHFPVHLAAGWTFD
jgi:hypothetical protein